jgi:hypothetical protein
MPRQPNLSSRNAPQRRVTYEIILSTFNDDGSPNAAPMGMVFVTRDIVQMRLYKDSNTSKNVLAKRCAIANLTNDALLFYKTAFKDKGGLPRRYFSRSNLVNAPFLKLVEGHIELELIKNIPSRDSLLVLFKVRRFFWKHVSPLFYNRGAHALVEATIHATRIEKFLPDRKKKKEVARLNQLINHYKDVIERVSPDSNYERAIRDLRSQILKWKKQL